MLIHFLKKSNEIYQAQSKQKAENKSKYKLQINSGSHIKENCLWLGLCMRREKYKRIPFL